MSIFFRFSNEDKADFSNTVVIRENFKSALTPMVQEGDIVFQNSKEFKISEVKENGETYKTELSKNSYFEETLLKGDYQVLKAK